MKERSRCEPLIHVLHSAVWQSSTLHTTITTTTPHHGWRPRTIQSGRDNARSQVRRAEQAGEQMDLLTRTSARSTTVCACLCACVVCVCVCVSERLASHTGACGLVPPGHPLLSSSRTSRVGVLTSVWHGVLSLHASGMCVLQWWIISVFRQRWFSPQLLAHMQRHHLRQPCYNHHMPATAARLPPPPEST